jgi:type VI secretion system secreted protein VgrG
MALYSQAQRLIAIETPLGEDVLLLQSFTGHESLSQLFHFQLELLSEDPSLAAAHMLGQRVTVLIDLADGRKRYMNGVVNRFGQRGRDTRFTHYQAEVVPWLWFLTRRTDCRIFQNMTVPDMITQIFQDLGCSDYTMTLTGQWAPREYCVQYRETDFHFVSRLLEQEGIFYFFEHQADKHTLVLANAASAHHPCPGQAQARCDDAGGALLQEDVITGWARAQELRSGKYALTDYNFETPSASLAVTIDSVVRTNGTSTYEMYDYPGAYRNRAHGEEQVKLRMEAEEALYTVVRGTSTCRAFLPGYRFTLAGHANQAMNAAYVLTQVQHVASVGDGYGTGTGEAHYTNHFTCIPHDVPYRPPRTTPRPIVQGPQTATVVGKSGEEIWTDKYGRVKVQFHWDRQGKRDEQSSCWIRVAQTWAGKRSGALFLPRLGQEVIVAFLEGDPDQPIILSSVYNAEYMPPYALPTQQTQSGFKSHSARGDGADSGNAWYWEDKKGEEQMSLHAAKDFSRVVKHDDSLEVGHDQTIAVKQHRQVQIDLGDDTLILKKGNQCTRLDTGKSTLEAMQAIELTVGTSRITINQHGVTIEAMQAIELTVGANSITVNQAGITLKGIMTTLEGQAMAQMKAPMLQINGHGMLQLKGGITMIG